MGEIGALNSHQPHHGSFSVVLSFIHHHFFTTNLALDAANLAYHPGDEPLPSMRDVGFVNTASAPSQARMSPLPFPKGCGRLSHTRRRIRGGRKTLGTH